MSGAEAGDGGVVHDLAWALHGFIPASWDAGGVMAQVR